MTTNKDIQYIFSSWVGFVDRLIQIFGDPEVTTTAERRL
jgi:hypothetical protein